MFAVNVCRFVPFGNSPFIPFAFHPFRLSSLSPFIPFAFHPLINGSSLFIPVWFCIVLNER
jgi:hypothetical protein